jgi:hypothetical protein
MAAIIFMRKGVTEFWVPCIISTAVCSSSLLILYRASWTRPNVTRLWRCSGLPLVWGSCGTPYFDRRQTRCGLVSLGELGTGRVLGRRSLMWLPAVQHANTLCIPDRVYQRPLLLLPCQNSTGTLRPTFCTTADAALPDNTGPFADSTCRRRSRATH